MGEALVKITKDIKWSLIWNAQISSFFRCHEPSDVHKQGGERGDVFGPPPVSFLPFHTTGCVTKHQLSGVSWLSACKQGEGESFIFSFKKCDLTKIVSGHSEVFGDNLNKAE